METYCAPVEHTFAPVCDRASRILILGTFPSVKSRENAFYYGHPQNRFWKVMAGVTGEAVPDTIEEKTALLLSHGIALWDVIRSCRINGSSDSSIRDVVPNDMDRVLAASPIVRIYGNGDKACRLYERYCQGQTGLPITRLPSTSPANAAFTLERLVKCWRRILEER